VAYVSEQNLEMDETGKPIDHPEVEDLFGAMNNGQYRLEVQMN